MPEVKAIEANIIPKAFTHESPLLTAFNDRLNLFFTDQEDNNIKHYSSIDAGGSWQHNPFPIARSRFGQSIALFKGKYYLIFAGESDQEGRSTINYLISPDGITWEDVPRTINLPGVKTVVKPSACVFKNRLHIVYGESLTSESNKYFSISSDDGRNWSDPHLIADGRYNATTVATETDFLALFRGVNSDQRIAICVSSNGEDWAYASPTQEEPILTTGAPEIVKLGSTDSVSLMYENAGGQLEIIAGKISAQKILWAGNYQRLAHSSDQQPSLAFFNDKLFPCWKGEGVYQIYFGEVSI